MPRHAAMVAGQVPDDRSRHELDALWRAAQDRLRGAVPESTFRLWLEPLRAVGADADTLYLTAPEGIRAWAERRYSAPDRRSAGRLRNPSAPGRLHLRPGACRRFRPGPRRGRAQPQLHLRSLRHRRRQPARPRCRPGRRRGPLGGLQPALPPRPSGPRQDPPADGDRQLPTGQRPRPQRPLHDRRVVHQRVRRGPASSAGAEAFKARYRDIDVLLIDDVQFLEGKPATEEEFFHTFNALYESGSQLVLSADRIPSELSTLASRLRDRFEWGLTVAVEPPNLATRLTVLRRLVQEAGIEIADAEALSRAGQPDRCQRAPAPRRPHPRPRPRLADGAAAQHRADRRGDSPRPLGSGDLGRGDPAAGRRAPSASPAPSWSAPPAPPPRCAPGRWRSSSPAR